MLFDKTDSPKTSNKTITYFLSVVFLILLNLIVFGLKGLYDYDWLDAHLTVLLWTLFQIFTVLIILYVSFRKYERFKKRAIISSIIVYGASMIAASIYIYIEAVFFCSTECGLLILAIPGILALGLYLSAISTLLSLYIYYVKKTYIHVSLLAVIFVITSILYVPPLLGGCAVYDYACRLDGVVEKAVLKGDPNVCKTFNGFVEDRCYNLYSVQATDFSACDNAFHSDSCRKDVAIASEDLALCETIDDSVVKELCIEGVAEVTGDIRLCEMIGTGGTINQRRGCYQKVAYATLDPEICRELLDSNVYCVRGVAARAKDPSICENYLDHRPSMDDCKSYIERGGIPLY